MFGLMKPKNFELRDKSTINSYKEVYCNICRRIGKQYGNKARIFLNYDITFFAWLIKQKNCGQIGNDITQNISNFFDFCASVNVLLAKQKIQDNIQDEYKYFDILLFRTFKKPFSESIEKLKNNNFPIEEYNSILGDFDDIEKAYPPNFDSLNELLDYYSNPIGKLTELFYASSSIFFPDTNDKELISNFGNLFGKIIYINDILEDYEKDKKRNNFNPLINWNLQNKELDINESFLSTIQYLENLQTKIEFIVNDLNLSNESKFFVNSILKYNLKFRKLFYSNPKYKLMKNNVNLFKRLKIKWIDSSNFVTQYFILKQFTIENSIISKIKYHLIFYLTMLTTLFFDKKVTYYKIAGDTGAIIFGIICFICCCYSFFKPGGMCQGQCCGGRDPYGPSCADICCESCRG
ncbi:MAG TPA: DUF5685 family protein [Candidatus Kapabacteria bacterium]|nr:DUF5685 family protein [Candidatus Kapabacteria bacterium]HPO61621.1 DUF5685 family protein [Candidatus Kapabacteria bacterium]